MGLEAQLQSDFLTPSSEISGDSCLKTDIDKLNDDDVRLADLTWSRRLGTGGFSTVDLVQRKNTYFAMKKIKKTKNA